MDFQPTVTLTNPMNDVQTRIGVSTDDHSEVHPGLAGCAIVSVATGGAHLQSYATAEQLLALARMFTKAAEALREGVPA